MTGDAECRREIRELVENWAVWRDAGDWERFRTVWHDDGRDDGDVVPGHRRRLHRGHRAGLGDGREHPALPRRHSVDVAGDRAIAQTKMTISQRGMVHGVLCDVVCTGRFYDFIERREGRWGLVLRQPIYEKDRIDPVDPAARLSSMPALSPRFPRATATSPTSRPSRLRGEARHARPQGARGGGALRARRGGCSASPLPERLGTLYLERRMRRDRARPLRWPLEARARPLGRSWSVPYSTD